MAPPLSSYVALDLETTGTNAQNDRIIEIGAVKFTTAETFESFHTFVNPGRALPYRVHVLTGIGEEELKEAPRFDAVADNLRRFAGDLPIVGQSVEFDVAFLAQGGLHLSGPIYDTFELASLFLPEARDYSLRGLAQFLDVDFPQRHRALADALAARDVFLALRQRLEDMPAAVIDEILRLSSSLDWPLRSLLLELQGPPQALLPLSSSVDEPFMPATPAEPPNLARRDQRLALQPQEASRYLRQAGRHDAIEDFEDRPQQLQMAEAVAGALSNSRHLVVEAGTGTGKSLAYLVPAALHALRNGEKVVISTDTIGLQEQLINKDIPSVRKVLEEVPRIDDLRANTMKGRRNYLCLLRWAQARREPARNLVELNMLIRLLIWAPRTLTGDRAELNLSQADESTWDRLSAQNANCLSGPCFYVKQGTCFLLRAKKRAESSHLLVVNHALLLSDLATEGGVLPGYQHLVIDEAHNLEAEATNSFGFEASQASTTELFEQLLPAQTPGGLVTMIRALSAGQPGLGEHLPSIQDLTIRGRRGATAFFEELSVLVSEVSGDNENERRIPLTTGLRTQPRWSDVEATWDGLAIVLYQLEEQLLKLMAGLLEGHRPGSFDSEALVMQVDALAARCRDLNEGISRLVQRHDPEAIAWIEVTRRGDISIASAPLSVAEILRQRLFDQKLSVTLTSATLTAASSFRYLTDRVGLELPEELLLGSPFDFERSVLMLLPTDGPEPHDNGYQASCEQVVSELVLASEGRTLALFTSHAALRATYHSIRKGLEQAGIQVLAQGLDGSTRQLINALRENHRTVILGTASFWEGVDIVGEALSTLIIARLPFAVPTDPIYAARSQLYEDPFQEYALPQAILRLKQGFGRLIRHRDDRGVVAVLDRRLSSKAYGELFLSSLPQCTVRRLPTSALARATGDWLRLPRPAAAIES